MEYSPKKMQEKMNENNFGFKKKFGQNFIIDENIINGIVTKAEIDDETLVIEIGPGAGSLTNGIAKKAKNVLCYEIDTTLENMLKDNLKEYNNIEIIFGDFLNANVIEDIKKYSYKKLYVVANLPYYITTPIILKLIEDKIMPDKIVVMVQKEVGDRFKAKPGTKDYSSLSVYLNYYFST
jgi:16S rRNA (adenine1518-N6/adenine1519-N6)-dimethyltransferase